MLCPPVPPAPIVEDWLARHSHPASFVMHLVGIPPTILAVLLVPACVLLASLPVFLLALALFIGGYLLQFLGHVLDGTEMGELAYFRRKLSARSRRGPVLGAGG